jgi:hypothetical protein
LKVFVCNGFRTFEDPTLLVSDDASSSTVEWRSNLLICARGDADVVSIVVGKDVVAPTSGLISIDRLGIPFLGPCNQLRESRGGTLNLSLRF